MPARDSLAWILTTHVNDTETDQSVPAYMVYVPPMHVVASNPFTLAEPKPVMVLCYDLKS
jgi:hypothetical protein